MYFKVGGSANPLNPQICPSLRSLILSGANGTTMKQKFSIGSCELKIMVTDQ